MPECHSWCLRLWGERRQTLVKAGEKGCMLVERRQVGRQVRYLWRNIWLWGKQSETIQGLETPNWTKCKSICQRAERARKLEVLTEKAKEIKAIVLWGEGTLIMRRKEPEKSELQWMVWANLIAYGHWKRKVPLLHPLSPFLLSQMLPLPPFLWFSIHYCKFNLIKPHRKKAS